MKSQCFRFEKCLVLCMLVGLGAPCAIAQAGDQKEPACRREEISKLVATLHDTSLQETDPERVVDAIQRLGDLRAVEAVDDLAAMLTFRRWFPWEKDPTLPKDVNFMRLTWARYPAISALALIGPPAVPALMRVIESHEPNSLETENAMELLKTLSRYDRPAYVRKVEEAAEKASSPEAADRLRKAAKVLRESKH